MTIDNTNTINGTSTTLRGVSEDFSNSTEDREIIIDDDTVRDNSSQSVKPSPLHLYALNGSKRQLQDCISTGKYDINGIDNMGRTPLIYSVLVEQIECVTLLLKSGADIDKPDSDGRTALHWAAYQGNHKLVKLIISKCKNKTSCDKEGRTPLHLSISHDNIKVMQIILRYLDDQGVDTADFKEMTALCWSVFYERIEHTRLLLRHGASKHVLDNEGRSILHWTSQNKTPTLIKMLIAEGVTETNFQDKEGRTLLHMAVGHGNYSIVQYLLTIPDIAVNQQDSINRTPLHWAAVLGQTAIVELLLSNDADYSLPDNNGVRALHYAAQNNNKDVVAAMLRTGKVSDEPDKEKRTALMWASVKGNVDVLKILLENCCGDINAVNQNQETALHMGCQAGHLECVKLLIHYKADINMMDKQNHIPLFYACLSGHAEIVSLVLSHKDQKNLYQRDLEGRTPLHYSAMVDRRDIIKILIQHGLDPNAKDNAGSPPLHIAAYGGFVHCMNVLLENKAQVNMQDAGGCTALHMACRSGILDAVKLLVSRYNANVNIYENSENNLTCLNYAILEDHQDVAFFLIENGAYTTAALQDLAAKIQATWRGYRFRKEFKPKLDLLVQHERQRRKISNVTSPPAVNRTPTTWSDAQGSQNLTAQFTSISGNPKHIPPLPPVSPTHQLVSHHTPRAASHIGIPTSRPRTRSTTSLLSGISIISSSKSSSHLSPDKAKLGGDSRQGPKFYDATNTNPFSLNRVARVKSPVPDGRKNVAPRAKSSTGVVAPYKRDAPTKHLRTNSTGNFNPGNFNFSSKSSTSSSDYFSARTDSTVTSVSQTNNKKTLGDLSYSRHGKIKTPSTPASSESAYFRAQSNHRPLPQISLPNDDASDTTSAFSTERSTVVSSNGHVPKPPTQPRKQQNEHSKYTVAPLHREESNNKPWNIYRRDQKRINIIRLKTDAAVKIQSAYRNYKVRKTQSSNTNMDIDLLGSFHVSAERFYESEKCFLAHEELSTTGESMDDHYMDSETDSLETGLSNDEKYQIPNEETLQEIAALVIQATWRQYVKTKLIREAKRNQNNSRSSRNHDDETNEINKMNYAYEIKKPKKSPPENNIEATTSIKTDLHENADQTTNSRPKSRKKSTQGKPKLMPSQSFPLMQNIYSESVRVKRTKRFSIKKRLLHRTHTVDQSTPLNYNGNLDNLSKKEMKALNAGRPKLFLVGNGKIFDEAEN